MSDSFPYSGHHRRQHQIVEQALQDKRQALQIIAIDIDAHKTADDAADGDNQQPVPHPPATDGLPSLLRRQVCPAVLPQVQQREDNGGGEHGRERNADLATVLQVDDGGVAGGGIEEGAVRVHARLEDVERQPAVASIGQGAIGVEGVVEGAEGGAVEMDPVDDDVSVIVSQLERSNLPGGEDHGEHPVLVWFWPSIGEDILSHMRSQGGIVGFLAKG